MATQADHRGNIEAMKTKALEYIETDTQIKELQKKQKLRNTELKAFVEGQPDAQFDCGDGCWLKVTQKKQADTWSEKIIAWLEKKGLGRLINKSVDSTALKACVKSKEIKDEDLKQFIVPGGMGTPALEIVRPK